MSGWHTCTCTPERVCGGHFTDAIPREPPTIEQYCSALNEIDRLRALIAEARGPVASVAERIQSERLKAWGEKANIPWHRDRSKAPRHWTVYGA